VKIVISQYYDLICLTETHIDQFVFSETAIEAPAEVSLEMTATYRGKGL